MSGSRTTAIDILLAGAVVLLVVATVLLYALPGVPGWAPLVPLIALAGVGALAVTLRWISRPDHRQALQSHRILEIADESLAHLSCGLAQETAQAVCGIVLARSSAAAVAITDTTVVLGFAGLGDDHHQSGQPILTEATRRVLAENETRVLRHRQEINCPNRRCPLAAAIVVPLQVRGEPIGTLKFYYTSPHALTETELAMADGLAQLLSTQLEISELERQTELACRMELKALQAQINPHFLFNTLNTIASLVRTDPVRARILLREFAAFYRDTLESSDDLITLEHELLYVRAYFRFEEARFAERVRLTDDVTSGQRRLLVPAFILQPIVENAIQHAMRPEGTLTVRLSAEVDGRRAILHVTDDGVGMDEETIEHVLDPGFGSGLGIALKNVDDRLRGHFGPGSGVQVESHRDVGTTVSLVIARRPQAA